MLDFGDWTKVHDHEGCELEIHEAGGFLYAVCKGCSLAEMLESIHAGVGVPRRNVDGTVTMEGRRGKSKEVFDA